MSKRKKDYLVAFMIAMIFIVVVFYFDLPKQLLIVLGVSVFISIILNEIRWLFQAD